MDKTMFNKKEKMVNWVIKLAILLLLVVVGLLIRGWYYYQGEAKWFYYDESGDLIAAGSYSFCTIRLTDGVITIRGSSCEGELQRYDVVVDGETVQQAISVLIILGILIVASIFVLTKQVQKSKRLIDDIDKLLKNAERTKRLGGKTYIYSLTNCARGIKTHVAVFVTVFVISMTLSVIFLAYGSYLLALNPGVRTIGSSELSFGVQMFVPVLVWVLMGAALVGVHFLVFGNFQALADERKQAVEKANKEVQANL